MFFKEKCFRYQGGIENLQVSTNKSISRRLTTDNVVFEVL